MKLLNTFLISSLVMLSSCSDSLNQIQTTQNAFESSKTAILVGATTDDNILSIDDYLNHQNHAITNASFEADAPNHSTTPSFWKNCGESGESPPDLHATNNSFFNVKRAAIHGKNFVGLVSRDSGTNESIMQKLEAPLAKGKKYLWSMYLARSDSYESPSKITLKNEKFTHPIVLQIYGGKSECDRKTLLATSPVIEHTKWTAYKFVFQPKEEYQFITLQVANSGMEAIPKNGNVLIDWVSPIVQLTKK